MKKILSIVLILIISLLLVVGCSNHNRNDIHQIQKEILWNHLVVMEDLMCFYALDELDLYDVKNQKSIDHVTNFKDIKPYVYSVGGKGYTKLYYENDKIIQSNKLENFSDLDKQIFKDLEKSKKTTRKI